MKGIPIMAMVRVDHSCGHSEKHSIPGNRSRQEWVADKLGERVCGDCWRAERDAEREAASRAAAAEAVEMALPELDGTDAQNDWAVVIRRDAINAAAGRRYGHRSLNFGEGFVADESWEPLYQLIVDAFTEISTVRWWLDSRFALTSTLDEVLLAIADRTGREAARELWRQTLTLAFPDRDWVGTWVHDQYLPGYGRGRQPLASPVDEVFGWTE